MTNPRSFLKLAILVLGVLFYSSCSDDGHDQTSSSGINQGVISFSLTYPYLDSNDIGLNLLPQELSMSFKDDVYRVESVGGMGLFLTGYVAREDKKEMDYFLKMISSKFASRFNMKGLKHLHKSFPSYRLQPLDSTKTICGYECKGYRVIYFNNKINDHNIWYTTDIALKNPNWCSPFPKVPGVMMSYQVQRSGLVINMEATEVRADSVNEASFHVPLEYKVISNRALIRKMEEAFMGFDY